MDVKDLHTTYNNGTGLAAAHALIVASGEVKLTITSAHTDAAIRANSDGNSINWPRVLRALIRREPGAGEG